jgi:amidase
VGPEAGDSFLVADGVLTRTVADTAAVLDVMAGYELGDSNWAPPPAEPFAESARRPPERLRVGLALNPPLEGAVVEHVCEQAARDAAALLEELGHEVGEVTPPWSGLNLLPDFTRAFGPMVSMVTAIGGRLRGREPTEDDVEPLTWMLFERARTQDTLTFLAAEGRLQSVARSIVSALAPFDIVVTPTLARRPVRIGEVHGRGPDPWENYQRSGHFTPFTAICNVTGQPAIALPLYHGEDSLPLGVHLIGRPAREDVLLSVASQLEQARPWAERLSPLAAG